MSIQRAFEAAGVEFTNGEQPGVRLTKAAAIQHKRLYSAPKPAIAKRLGGEQQNTLEEGGRRPSLVLVPGWDHAI